MEKGFDRINISADSPEEKADIEKDLTIGRFGKRNREFRRINLKSELPKTEEELGVIHLVFQAANKLLSDEDLPLIDFSEDIIHIMPGYDQQNHGYSGHYNKKGHIFLGIAESIATFEKIIAHELMHYISFVSLDVKQSQKQKEFLSKHGDGSSLSMARMLKEQGVDYELENRRSGFEFEYKIGDQKMLGFSGFNEGVTEFLGYNIRISTAKMNKADTNNVLLGGYVHNVLLVIKLAETVAQENELDYQTVWSEIISNYMTGDFSFFKKLESKHKGATKILFEMGNDPSDVQKAAQELGLGELKF